MKYIFSIIISLLMISGAYADKIKYRYEMEMTVNNCKLSNKFEENICQRVYIGEAVDTNIGYIAVLSTSFIIEKLGDVAEGDRLTKFYKVISLRVDDSQAQQLGFCRVTFIKSLLQVLVCTVETDKQGVVSLIAEDATKQRLITD